MLNDSATVTAALTDEERTAIHEQLERLLSNSHFKQSRRFPSFLRFVIDQTLQGQTDLLKERTLGIEIFGRDHDYDTSSDPIVRVTATEIRKRIAQYYQEPGHETELRLSLPSGSYVPQFHWPPTAKQNGDTQAAIILSPPASVPEQGLKEEIGEVRTRRPFLAAALVVVLLCAGAAFLWHSVQRSPFDFFWGPLVKANEPVLFCVADQSHYSTITLRDAGDPSRQIVLQDNLT